MSAIIDGHGRLTWMVCVYKLIAVMKCFYGKYYEIVLIVNTLYSVYLFCCILKLMCTKRIHCMLFAFLHNYSSILLSLDYTCDLDALDRSYLLEFQFNLCCSLFLLYRIQLYNILQLMFSCSIIKYLLCAIHLHRTVLIKLFQ